MTTKRRIGPERVLAALNAPMGDNDAGAGTVREYLCSLLLTLFAEGEGFSGKRPFGNSGWEYELYLPLVNAKLVLGTLDCEGYLASFDEPYARRLIEAAIDSFGDPK